MLPLFVLVEANYPRLATQTQLAVFALLGLTLAFLRERCRREGIHNIETVLGKHDHPLLPEGVLDMAVMVWVFHMVDDPAPLLANLRSSLKPGAPLVILDPHDEEIRAEIELRGGDTKDLPTLKERIEKAAAASGFEIARVETFLPKDYIFVLRTKANG